jgi:hypothetical protein
LLDGRSGAIIKVGSGRLHAIFAQEGDRTVPHTQYTRDEIVQCGQALYEQEIRPKVESENKGKYLILNVDTGDYDMDSDDLIATRRARAKYPDAPLFTVRIGYPTAYRLGGNSAIGPT